jgi:hypothetical protein
MTNKPRPKERDVPIAWEALEDAFENNAPEVHSYLHMDTGEVIRIVDGVADPSMHGRVANDAIYLRIDPVSSREQYRWMERFIATVEEGELRSKLVHSIDGKGAFRRFKDVLMSFPVDRERWFTFRSERLRACMEAWLQAHGITPVERPKWRVPTADEVKAQVEQAELERPGRRTRAEVADANRQKLHEVVDLLPARELEAALAFLEFLRERKHTPRLRAKRADASSGGGADAPSADGEAEDTDDLHDDDEPDDDEGARSSDSPA